MSHEEDLAYLAGAIDADGWIGVFKAPPRLPRSYPKYHLRVALEQCSPEAVQLAACVFGGSVSVRRQARKAWKPSYHWEATGSGAESVLSLLVPLLLIKRRQAEYGLRMRRVLGDGRKWGCRTSEKRTRWASLAEAFYRGMKGLVRQRLSHA